MRGFIALLPALLAITVTSLAIPDSPASAGITGLTPRQDTASDPGLDDADILISNTQLFASQFSSLSNYLDLLASDTFISQKAYLAVARAAHKVVVAQLPTERILASYIGASRQFPPAGKRPAIGTASDAWDWTRWRTHALASIDYTDLQNVQWVVKNILFAFGLDDSRAYCYYFLPNALDMVNAAQEKLQELDPGNDALDGVSIDVPESCSPGFHFGPVIPSTGS